jgi:hypothetical protein
LTSLTRFLAVSQPQETESLSVSYYTCVSRALRLYINDEMIDVEIRGYTEMGLSPLNQYSIEPIYGERCGGIPLSIVLLQVMCLR